MDTKQVISCKKKKAKLQERIMDTRAHKSFMVHKKKDKRGSDRKNVLGQPPVVLLGDLRLVERTVKHGGIVVDVLDVYDDCSVVLVTVI